MRAMARASEWLSTTDAKDRLGITLRTLYKLIDEGQLPAYKIGRVIRLREEDVATFIDQSRIKPGSLEHLYPSTGRDEGADSSG
jgi:excisionase family DNA binding protein